MKNSQDQINELLEKLEILSKKQYTFSREIHNLRTEINKLKTFEAETSTEKEAEEQDITVADAYFEIKKEKPNSITENYQPQKKQEQATQKVPIFKRKAKSNLERFIGENLINKIGIGITIIGVAIGAKYAIDNQLINPMTRIILGYLVGIGLLGFAIKLKKNYLGFSAVLLSGSMTIMYFLTFAAHSFYDLIPQVLAFILMVLFTAFTVTAAINYNKQVIAHIGLVGAYAVPFLLSDGTGEVAFLFSYTAIINAGILALAFKKYWKPLYYSSFGLTWLMYFSWYALEFQTSEHFGLALTFLIIFFSSFYLTFLSYKLLQNEKFDKGDIILLLSNSFIFYGIGYSILDNHKTGEQLLGLFTLCNAIIHFIVSAIIYKQKLADKNLFYLISGLVLIFITIAIPVQIDGNWVTLLWVAEAALLFWIGRTKNVPVYEKLSYPLMILAFFSIVQDWKTFYDSYSPENPETRIIPLININFLSSILFISAFGLINFLNRSKKYISPLVSKNVVSKGISIFIPAILLFIIYFAFRLEIVNYWNQLFKDSAISISSEAQDYPNFHWNSDLNKFKLVWIINYSLLFVSLLGIINFRKLKNQQLGFINLGLIILAVAAFLIQGLYELSGLRESYLEQTLSQYYPRSAFNIGIRYISLTFVSLPLFVCYKYIRQDFMKQDFKKAYSFLLHTSILWIASSELINWMDIAESNQSYKLGLSILWGIYALLLIVLGIWKKQKHLRIGAIGLFGATLIKLFFYDISHMDTISKTIVFVSLGILLLIISFLYNKYKNIISDEADN